MKKIVYLLLITLLFAGCKKNNKDKDATNEISIKGKWKAKEAKIKYYDAYGNVVRSKSEECKPADSFYVEFDGNNKAIFTDFNDTNESVSAYVYQNGCLTIIGDDNNNEEMTISQPTENSIVCQVEPNEVDLADIEKKIESNESNDDIGKNAINGTAPQNSISEQIVKTIVYYTFIKVN